MMTNSTNTNEIEALFHQMLKRATENKTRSNVKTHVSSVRHLSVNSVAIALRPFEELFFNEHNDLEKIDVELFNFYLSEKNMMFAKLKEEQGAKNDGSN